MKTEKFLVIREENLYKGEVWHFLFKDTILNRKFFNKSKGHYEEDHTYRFYEKELTVKEIENKKKLQRISCKLSEFNFMEGDYNWDQGMKKIKERYKYRELELFYGRGLDPFSKGQFEEFRYN